MGKITGPLVAAWLAVAGIGWGLIYLTARFIASRSPFPLVLLAVACLVASFFIVRNNRKLVP